MSFYGKKFKRTKAEGLDEFMDAIKIDEKMRGVSKTDDSSYTVILKNDDGTYSLIMSSGDKEVLKHTFKFGEESDFKRPDGVVMRTKYELNGGKLLQTMTDPEGRHFTFTREYSNGDNSLKMTITVAEMDVKATMYFEAI